ncbi:hypothetical protein AMJ86_09135, partial [bacterium SM23_57]
LVSGSDQAVYPPASETLTRLNIPMRTPYNEENVPKDVDLVVVGNTCSRGHPEVEVVLERGRRYRSLPEVLKEEFLWDRYSLVVTGTHGKTTTSSMLAWFLTEAGHSPSFFIGGRPNNFPEPFHLGNGEEFVVEGDEYDSAFFDKRAKFLHYCPRGVILGQVEFDHSDIYQDIQAVELAFSRLLLLIPKNGMLVASGDHDRVRRLAEKAFCRVVTFGCEEGSDWQAADIKPSVQGMTFRLLVDGADQGEFVLGQWGKYNVMNALGAMVMAHHQGVSLDQLRDALMTFSGAARRMEELGEVGGVMFVDDFAHHPTAIMESIAGLRSRYIGRRIIAVFEPRSNTTVRKYFQREIAEALGEADVVFVGPIYRLDQIPVEERLDILWVLDYLELSGTPAFHQNQFDDLTAAIRSYISPGDVVVFMSNGGFGGIARRIMTA